jgi:4-amino-4-deoxy-L-arabinose transferase-like glycosyltransferase
MPEPAQDIRAGEQSAASPARAGFLERDEVQLAGLTLIVKLAILNFGVFAVVVIARQQLAPGLGGVLQIWNWWDAPHYLDLAVLGYRAVDPGVLAIEGYARPFPGDLPLYIVFFPLFPWLVAAVNAVLHEPLVSALIVSTIASLFVAPLLYRLVRADEERGTALLAAWFLLIFPTAYFLHIGYTESLFLALVLGSFLAARRDRWWLAGILGGLAALTRVNGLVLIPALAADAWLAWDEDPEHRLRLEWLAIGLVAVGFAGYLVLNWTVYGNAFAFLQIQREHWFKELAPPWQGIGGIITTYILQPHDAIATLKYGWFELGAIALGLAGTVVAAFHFRPSWFVWMAGNWILFTSTSFVLSVPRYSLTLFPLFAWFALLGKRREVAFGLSVVSIALMGYFISQFAIGEWAF